MFNATVQQHSTHITKIEEKEDIKLSIKHVDDESYFLTINRNGNNYKTLMGETPYYTKYNVFVKVPKEELYYHDRKIQLSGGYRTDSIIYVKIVGINYVGNNEFLFEVKTIK